MSVATLAVQSRETNTHADTMCACLCSPHTSSAHHFWWQVQPDSTHRWRSELGTCLRGPRTCDGVHQTVKLGSLKAQGYQTHVHLFKPCSELSSKWCYTLKLVEKCHAMPTSSLSHAFCDQIPCMLSGGGRAPVLVVGCKSSVDYHQVYLLTLGCGSGWVGPRHVEACYRLVNSTLPC